MQCSVGFGVGRWRKQPAQASNPPSPPSVFSSTCLIVNCGLQYFLSRTWMMASYFTAKSSRVPEDDAEEEEEEPAAFLPLIDADNFPLLSPLSVASAAAPPLLTSSSPTAASSARLTLPLTPVRMPAALVLAPFEKQHEKQHEHAKRSSYS